MPQRLANYSFLVVFANDSTISEEELKMLKRIATADKVVDEQEKQVLRSIFSRVSQESLSPKVREDIQRFRTTYGI